MNNEWQDFLDQQGALIEDNRVVQFTDPDKEREATANGHVIVDLSHYGLISAEGEEAQDFLQNQFSNDVRLVDANLSQLSSYCSPKGRILADFRLFLHDSSYYLRLPGSILEPTLKRLRMFILRSKVTLEDVSNNLSRFGFSGADAPGRLADILTTLPTQPNQVTHSDGITIIRLPGPMPRFEFHGQTEVVMGLWRRLARQAQPVGADRWDWLNIQSGIPEISTETIEAFVPQMINLTALDGVSFKKGCYPGQEVVARMHYLGKLKRRMYRAHVETESLPEPGDSLFSSDSSEQGIGKVVKTALAPGGGVDLLAVIQITSSADDVHLASNTGPVLELGELPYTVTNEA